MTVAIDYNWPQDFIEGVPPQEATPANGKVYRLVKSIPPQEDDFLQHNVEKPNYPYRDELARKKGFGVSLWSTLHKVKRAGKNYPAPNQLGEWLIASGELVVELGVIYKSKNGHVSLWKQCGAKPHLHMKNQER
ncbi:hypothetical protein ACFO4O_14010 [Glaciecola siphonariae]|uniref:Uncharacterized protein n=1 Tax=Glaciecola siphonariae TaxID=521012 RepID=A0ABV9M0Q4_9ALTE